MWSRRYPADMGKKFDLTPNGWWVSLILGLLLIAGGIYMVLHAVAASIVTSIFFGAILAVGGIFQAAHATLGVGVESAGTEHRHWPSVRSRRQFY